MIYKILDSNGSILLNIEADEISVGKDSTHLYDEEGEIVASIKLDNFIIVNENNITKL